MHRRIPRSVFHLAARRICSKEVVVVPIRRKPGQSRNEPTTAISADISQNGFDVGDAEGALIGADPRLKRIGRQRLVAMLTGWPEFKHRVLDAKLPVTGNQWFLEQFLTTVPLLLRLARVDVFPGSVNIIRISRTPPS